MPMPDVKGKDGRRGTASGQSPFPLAFLKGLYLTKRFFAVVAALVALCVAGYWVPLTFLAAQIGLVGRATCRRSSPTATAT
jgi:hypothetical protein